MTKIFPDEVFFNKVVIFRNSDRETKKSFRLWRAKDSLRLHIFSRSGYFQLIYNPSLAKNRDIFQHFSFLNHRFCRCFLGRNLKILWVDLPPSPPPGLSPGPAGGGELTAPPPRTPAAFSPLAFSFKLNFFKQTVSAFLK